MEQHALLDWILSNRNYFLYLSFVISVPSTLLYIVEIGIILRYQALNRSAFYRLFCVRAVSDIFQFLASCYGNRLPTLFGAVLLPVYQRFPSWMLASFYFLTTYTYIVTNVFTALMLANRATAIIFPLRQTQIWSRLYPVLTTASLIAPMMFTFPEILFPSTLTLQNGGSFLISISDNNYANQLKAVTSIIFLFVCAAINLFNFYAYKRSKNSSGNASDQIERKLLIYALLTFAGHALLAAFLYAVGQGLLGDYVPVVYSQYPWITDLCTTGLSSWMMCWASSELRSRLAILWRTFWPKRLYTALFGGAVQSMSVIPTIHVSPAGQSITVMRQPAIQSRPCNM